MNYLNFLQDRWKSNYFPSIAVLRLQTPALYFALLGLKCIPETLSCSKSLV